MTEPEYIKRRYGMKLFTENYEPIGPGNEMLNEADYTEQFGKTILVAKLTYQSKDDRDAHLQARMEVGMRESTERLGGEVVVDPCGPLESHLSWAS